MKYNNKELLLDNFRMILKDFSVDIQDVVRSAILDGVDIEKYIVPCSQNPYRLDQIRLGVKEGIDSRYFEYKSGEIIRGIRGLLSRGVNLSPFLKYKAGVLSDKCLLFLIYWCKEGYDPSYLNLAIIPDYLLEFFDFCLRYNFNVKKFNNGTQYGLSYLDYLIKIMESGCKYDKYSENYNQDVIEYMCLLAGLPSKGKYNALYEVLDSKCTSVARLKKLEKAFSLGLNVSVLAKISDESVVDLIIDAKEKGVSVDDVDIIHTPVSKLKPIINTRLLNNNRLLSGKFASGKK